MPSPAIKVENLSKLYRLGAIGTGTLSHDLNRWWHRVRGKEDPYALVGHINDRTTVADNDYIWALKNINFEVKKGEILGIIGRNGAGKSTLLKILSKVTGPTEGKIFLNGKIASLLEVGTGFHPELSGRENIYLNGAILGMTRKEIAGKFDEIVDFSGCERYIDTPVKRYSSGMKVRLGFAVAAHLEPDILIVDEVLAVGDAEFQRKCIGKMQEVSGAEGRTILFVSHNFSQVQSLCTRGLLLDKGMITDEGGINKVIAQYTYGKQSAKDIDLVSLPRAGHAVPGLKFTRMVIEKPVDQVFEGDMLQVKIDYETYQPLKEVLFGITFSDAHQTLVECRSTASFRELNIDEPGKGTVTVQLQLNLTADNYAINLGARCLAGLLEYIPSITTIEVLPGHAVVDLEDWKRPNAGKLITASEWSFE
jgi:lipopolysaccharide transport system ATP-binding protein